MRSAIRNAKWKAATVILAAAAWGSPVRADVVYFPNQPSNGGDKPSESVDFTTASIPMGTSGALNGLKYWVLNLSTYNSSNQCFDIETRPDDDSTGDTRIWVYDPSITNYRSLNNNSNASDGPKFSHARIWISPPSNGGRYVSPVISGLNSSYNSLKFIVRITKLPSTTTETQCTVGATYKAKASGNSFVNAT